MESIVQNRPIRRDLFLVNQQVMQLIGIGRLFQAPFGLGLYRT
jgi:hypothetical protein